MRAIDTSSGRMYQQQGAWCAHPERQALAKKWLHKAGVASSEFLIAEGKVAGNAEVVQAIQSAATQPRANSGYTGTAGFDTADFPESDANQIADKCKQIGAMRATRGANQSESDWHNSLGVLVFCQNGEQFAHDWSDGHVGYSQAATDRKIDYRKKYPPTTCHQFRVTNPDGCDGCTQTCRSPITLGWIDTVPSFTDAEMNAAVEAFEVCERADADNAVGNTPAEQIGNNTVEAEPAAVLAPQVTEADRSAILALNNQFAFIEESASIYREEFGNFIDPSKFRLQHDNRIVNIVSGNKIKQSGLGSAWLASSKRRQHKRLVLRPGEGRVTADNCLNEWQGFDIAPAKGDVRPFVRLLVRMMPNRAARRYVQKWMAHIIQKPGVKIFVSLAIWSHDQGVGKNLVFETLVAIIGSTHATIIGQDELNGAFNDWANRRILAIGDEVSSSDKRQQQDKLKGLITGTTIHLNAKYQPDREQPNLLNFVFLSNHHDALFVNDHDRRFFVWEVDAGRLPEAQAKSFVEWRDNGGLAALHHWLLNYPLGDFNPKAPAPMTLAKQQMAEDNRSDLEAWLADLLASDVAATVGRELATANELGRLYQIDTGHNAPSSKAIVGAAKRFGVYARPAQVRLADGKKVRVLALTRQDYWRGQLEAAWTQEMAKGLKCFELA